MKFQKIIFLIAIIWYTVTAWFSSGYLHPDEHYQIIEFAGYINGWNNSSELMWEFESQIRSSIQPFLCALFLKIWKWINIDNPFHQGFLLRLITGLFSVFCIRFFVNSCNKFVPQKFWKTFVVMSFFLWFLPFINVRFSSETWSGLFLLLGVGTILRGVKNYFLLGLILGFSFLFRFQAGIIIATIFLWFLIKNSVTVKQVSRLCFGFLAILFLGIFLDFLFYNNWTFTGWNYFYMAFLDINYLDFGVSPFYFYFKEVYRKAFTPFGVLIIASFIYALVKKRNHIVTWVIFVFVLIHSAIPHKEFRFLFPIINFLPLLIIWFVTRLSALDFTLIKFSLFRAVLFVFFVMNLTSLTVASTIAPSTGLIETANQIHNLKSKKEVNFFYTKAINPYTPYGMKANFYSARFVKMEEVFVDSTYSFLFDKTDQMDVLAVSSNHMHHEVVNDFIERLNLKLRNKNVNNWALPFLKIYGAHDSNVVLLFTN